MRLWRFKLCVSLKISGYYKFAAPNNEHKYRALQNDFFLDVDTIHTAALSDSAEDKYLLLCRV